MYSLIIETSTDRGVIACIKNQEAIFVKEFLCDQNHSKILMPYLATCLAECKIQISDLSCIGVGVGPGSYTGIRVGVSVAQALAFGYDLPIVEISSLNGFVPRQGHVKYAAIIDARIAGAYVQKGRESGAEDAQLSDPEVCSLEKLPDWLEDIEYLVTPNSQSLQVKLARIYPNKCWRWEERFPCVLTLAKQVELAYAQGKTKQAGDLSLLYLRETLAERQREMKLANKNLS